MIDKITTKLSFLLSFKDKRHVNSSSAINVNLLCLCDNYDAITLTYIQIHHYVPFSCRSINIFELSWGWIWRHLFA